MIRPETARAHVRGSGCRLPVPFRRPVPGVGPCARFESVGCPDPSLTPGRPPSLTPGECRTTLNAVLRYQEGLPAPG